MTKPEKQRIRVFCDEASHAKKVATIHVFELHYAHGDYDRDGYWCDDLPGRWRLVATGEIERLIGDKPVDSREVFGSALAPGRPEIVGQTRDRWPLECPLCGLRKAVRRETIEPVLIGAVEMGESEIRLAFLAANL